MKALKFKADSGEEIWRRHRDGCEIAVDLPEKGEGRIRYGKPIRHGGGDGEFSRGFEQGENLVALECICRLLDKGYKPEHLILEKQWRIGRTPKGGRADIVVREPDPESSNGESTLLIIECKTWGTEYENEIRRMERNGGQLFSYLQQTTDARYLCLYCSRVGSDGADYENAIVKIADRPEDEEAAKKDDSVLLYKNASTVEQRHEVWKKNFNLYLHYNGIFEDDVNAYKVDLTPLKGRNLIWLGDARGLFNRFSEILRHNNISDNANAFNRVLSLILCKIVDEDKGEDEVLDFQIREGEDTPEKVQDRLQALYQRGMRRYLGEEIIYHSDEEIENIVRRYPERSPLDAVVRIFREIKYYTNNEFAFKEVHNKALFEQNARVLGEVVKMLQNYRFKHAKKQQLLGDFFESLLNHGVKQSQGQFFTPLPVVQFILRSVGVGRTARRRLDEGDVDFLPRVIDYACGAGHFLTECMENIRQTLVDVDDTTLSPKLQKRVDRCRESTEWARGRVFGVEKDYRLARTAQIACFLNGDGEARIIHGDGLEEHSRLGKKKFDILVANPPYSVKAFANYLESGAKKFRLAKELSEKASEIEALFVERAAQLLAPGGAAGIILPATILSNKGVHARARELLLEKFEIRAVAEMGGSTFIATGTKTVILFLRRRRDAFMIDRARIATDFFYPHRARGDLPDYIDNKKLLDNYARRRDLPPALYRDIVGDNPSAAAQKTPLFQSALRAFESSSAAKQFKKSPAYCKMTAAEQKREWERRFRKRLLETEWEKFYFFMLCLNDDGGGAVEKPGCYDSQLTAAARSGDDKDQQRHFLGYEFSDRRGSEGLKYIDGQAEGGLMYDLSDDDNLGRVSAHLLRRMWDEPPATVPSPLKEHVKVVRLTDCIDFEAENFDKAINVNLADSLAAAKAQEENSRWGIIGLGDYIDFLPDSIRPAEDGQARGKYPFFNSSRTQSMFLDKADYTERAVIVGDGGKSGVHIASAFSCSNHNHIIKTKNGLLPDFLYYWLFCNFDVLTKGLRGSAGPPNISKDYVRNIRLPLPPEAVQKKIAAECAAIDRDSELAKKEIARLHDEINHLIGGGDSQLSDVASLSADKVEPSQFGDERFHYVGLEHIESGTGRLLQKTETPGGEIKSTKTRFQKGDVLFGRLRAYLNKVHIAEFDGICSTDILVLRADNPLFVKYALMSDNTLRQTANLTKGVHLPRVSGHDLLNIAIPAAPKGKAAMQRLQKADARIAALREQIDSAPARKATAVEREL